MGRSLSQLVADIPTDRQSRIDARYREMKDQVERLRALRQVSGKPKTEIAAVKRAATPR
jgi:hypothetical protein